jgi:hypothetical protein
MIGLASSSLLPRLVPGGLALLLLLSASPSAYAASFSINFCPGHDTCPQGVTEASLTFLERLDTSDVNDYFVDLKLVGSAAAPDFVDLVSFKIDTVSTPDGYEIKPQLVSAPPGQTWTTYFDNVNGSDAACTNDTGQQQAVCSNSPGAGAPLAGQSLLWRYDVDLAGTVMLAAGSAVNLRASFVDMLLVENKGKKGAPSTWLTEYRHAGILSPGGGALACVEGCAQTPDERPSTIPEPGMLALVGLGLLGAGYAHRRARR